MGSAFFKKEWGKKICFALAKHKMMISTHLQAKGNSGCYVPLISLMTIFTKQTTVHLLVHGEGA